MAEYRELPRIFGAVRERIAKGQGFDDIPKDFRLGTAKQFIHNKGTPTLSYEQCSSSEGPFPTCNKVEPECGKGFTFGEGKEPNSILGRKMEYHVPWNGPQLIRKSKCNI